MLRILALIGIAIASCAAGRAGVPDVLVLKTKVPLGNVRGRIDHLAVDVRRKRLFVAELGNDSVGIVDLEAGKLLHRITGLNEPQGVGYVPSVDVLYVANRADGSVRLFAGDDYAPLGRIDLGADADNVRVDAAENRVFVGYGAGALAVIDPVARRKVADIPLKAHPESFQLDSTTKQIFVNLPRSVGGSIDLNGCDLKGTTLPQSVGGWLDLRGCNLDGIALPQSVGRSLLDGGDFLNQFEKRKIRGPLWSP